MAQADEEDQKEKVRKDYADFLEKVKKTVFINNISPKATTLVVESALQQFGNVVNVEFMPNYMIPYNIPQCALVEMEDQKQALKAIDAMTNYPFMMGGMPRPVRVTAAKVEMFCDRPAPPDRRKIRFRWMQPTDPHFHAMKKFRWLARRHTAESLAMIKVTRSIVNSFHTLNLHYFSLTVFQPSFFGLVELLSSIITSFWVY